MRNNKIGIHYLPIAIVLICLAAVLMIRSKFIPLKTGFSLDEVIDKFAVNGFRNSLGLTSLGFLFISVYFLFQLTKDLFTNSYFEYKKINHKERYFIQC